MRKIFCMIKNLAFWGIVFLLVLIFGFGVRFKDIFSIAFSFEWYLAAYCLYFLVSIILFPLLLVLIYKFDVSCGLSLGDIVPVDLPATLWMPYKGLDIHGLFKMKKSGLDASGVFVEIGIHVRRLFETLLWWAIVIFGIYTIFNQGDNAILKAINEKSSKDKLIVLGVALGVYLLLSIISWLVQKASVSRWRDAGARSHSQTGTGLQRYFDRHPERLPSVCSACGGPYPECRESCNVLGE